MERFMIGQYGDFSEEKYAKDFRQGFYGIEACMLESEAEVEKLLETSRKDGYQIGVHFPLRAWANKLRDPQFLSSDNERRAYFYQLMEEELQYLQKVKPKYVLFHYPKPVILDDNVDWSLWRFGDKSEYVFQSEYSYQELEDRSEQLFSWLSEKAEEYSFIPVLELDALNEYVYRTDLLEKLLNRYPKVRLCLDLARLHLQDKLDPNFDAVVAIKRFAKYAHNIHLSTVRVSDNLEKNHFPALPDLNPAEGWAPIEEYMTTLQQHNQTAKIMFEHRSDLITAEELQSCYDWIQGMINKE